MVLRQLAFFTVFIASLSHAQDPTPLDNPHFDKAIYDSCASMLDLDLASLIAFTGYMEAPESNKSGPPGQLTTRRKMSLDVVKYLKSITSADRNREKLRATMQAYMEATLSANNLLVEGFNKAQTDKAWTPDAKTMVEKANATYLEINAKNPLKILYDFIQYDANFRARCPQELEKDLGLDLEDDTKFALGTSNYTDEKTTNLRFVAKGMIAHFLGFRSGDTLKSLNGQPIDDMLVFKRRLADLQGKKADMVITRDGADKTLSVQVPADLTQFDNDPTATAEAKAIFQSLMDGNLDRKKLNEDCNKNLTPELATQIKTKLTQMGKIESFQYKSTQFKDGITMRVYAVVIGQSKSVFSLYIDKNGIIVQLAID
jgi:hypothetical protein